MQLLTDAELLALPIGDTFFGDVEIYGNFYLVLFLHEPSGKYVRFGMSEQFGVALEARKLSWFMHRFRTVGFNWHNFDVPIIQLSIKGFGCSQLMSAGNDIIKSELRRFSIFKKYKIDDPKYNSIDLIEVAPLKASLKTYGARLGAKKIQDLPYPPGADLSPAQMREVTDYCANDLNVTRLLWDSLQDAIELREELGGHYGIDLRSKSNAQCAEAIFKSITGARPAGVRPGPIFYKVPSFIRPDPTGPVADLVAALEREPFIVEDDGKVTGPDCLSGKKRVTLGGKPYTVGIGGLHSNEKSICYRSGDTGQLFDYDVASYYPRAIDIQNLYPPSIGPRFLELYRGFINTRLAYKKAGEKRRANALKIVINGIFGKLRSKYSIFYDPQSFIQVTITGQLILLMLIEALEANGITVVSANTDGIVILCPSDKIERMQEIVGRWEAFTGFEMEGTKYDSIFFRDVNNYIAVKGGSIKAKGAYSWQEAGSEESLSKNPKAPIVAKAVAAFLKDGKAISETLNEAEDVLDFCIVRHVTGGAQATGHYLGKTVRFYYSDSVDAIEQLSYCKNGNKVPESENCMPLMELGFDFPIDVNLRRYEQECIKCLQDMGVLPKPVKERKPRNKK